MASLRSALSLALATLGPTLAAGAARAAPPERARLDYSRGVGAEACPTAERFGQLVSERIGYAAFDARAPRLVRVGIARRGGEWVGVIAEPRASGGEVHRDLASNAARCDDLADALALGVALLIDPRAALAPPRAAATPEPASSPPVVPSPVRDSIPDDDPPPAPEPSLPLAPPAGSALRLGFGAGPTGWVGVLPGPSVGGEIFAELGRPSWSIALEAAALAPSSVVSEQGPGARAGLLALTLAPCGRRGALFACGLLTAGAITADGAGDTVRSRMSTAPHASLGARAGAELALGEWLVLRLHADLLLPVTRLRLNVSGAEVWSAPAVGGAAGIALGVRWR